MIYIFNIYGLVTAQAKVNIEAETATEAEELVWDLANRGEVKPTFSDVEWEDLELIESVETEDA